jgi:hypothetical protein
MSSLGPNTNAPPELLSPKVLLVCGEDRRELLPFVRSPTSHAFRCFEFWKEVGFTLVLSGMGTGCVEPLIWELTRPGIVREIVLAGTAGKMPGTRVPIGQPHEVSEAFAVGTALDGERISLPVKPRWARPTGLSSARSVSTDFFYGFAPRIQAGDYPLQGGSLAAGYAEHWARGTPLIDMEVAAFYCFCERFGDAGLQYLAIKVPSNELGADAQQIEETPQFMPRCIRAALKALEIQG